MSGAGAGSNKKARQTKAATAAVGAATTAYSPSAAMSDLDQIKALRSCLLTRSPSVLPPGVRPDGRAVRAALDGLERERKRIERDEKLRAKFAASSSAASAVGAATRGEEEDDEGLMEWQDVSAAASAEAELEAAGTSAEASQDGANDDEALASSGEVLGHVVDSPRSPEESALGKELGSLAVAAVASSRTLVRDPLSAIALVVHAALVSDTVGFRCTGIPPESDGAGGGGGGKGGGFAAPIRELPKSKFVPDGWDTWKGNVLLRYRKDGVGSAVLRVSLQGERCGEGSAREEVILSSLALSAESVVSLSLGPSGEALEPLEFPLGRHVNLDGLAAALSRQPDGKVNPALHYKALGQLLSSVAATFDLGHVTEKQEGGAATGEGVVSAKTIAAVGGGPLPDHVGAAARTAAGAPGVPPDGAAPPHLPPSAMRPPLQAVPPVGGHHPRIEDLDPTLPVGDFAGDLAPGGVIKPYLGGIRSGGGEGSGGNLMGPNHPAFRGNGGVYGGIDDDDLIPGGSPLIGGMGMQPRFDPYYPPGAVPPGGVPGGPGRGMGRGAGRGAGRGRGQGRGRGRVPPSGGDPNPDHQRPPSDLGGNMFM